MRADLMIGASTGWLYAREIFLLRQQESILKTAGANVVETCLANWDSNDRRMLSLRDGKAFDVQTFVYRSLHLPVINDQEPEHQLAMAQDAVVCCNAITALTHPAKIMGDYPVEYYERMISGGVPLALENMDLRKDSGFNLTELERLVKVVGCSLVLDVQHAYEHDHEMGYANDLLESLKDQLVHLHVSGETENNIHALVSKATNAKKIVEFVNQVLSVKNVPLILEGEYATTDELREEIEFLRRELS